MCRPQKKIHLKSEPTTDVQELSLLLDLFKLIEKSSKHIPQIRI